MAVRIETRGSQRGALACAVCIPSCCRSSRIRPSAGIEMLWYTRAAKPKALHHGRLRGVLPCERRIFSSAVVDASLSFRRECGQCLLNFYTWLRSRAASRVGTQSQTHDTDRPTRDRQERKRAVGAGPVVCSPRAPAGGSRARAVVIVHAFDAVIQADIDTDLRSVITVKTPFTLSSGALGAP